MTGFRAMNGGLASSNMMSTFDSAMDANSVLDLVNGSSGVMMNGHSSTFDSGPSSFFSSHNGLWRLFESNNIFS